MFVDYTKKSSKDAALFHPKDHLESDLLFLGLLPSSQYYEWDSWNNG